MVALLLLFHMSQQTFNQANDVYIKIYETVQQTMFYVFKSINKYPRKLCKCIVGCIFNSVGLIIAREIPCIDFFRMILFDVSFMLYLTIVY
jgi:hypothetical protein